MTPADPPLLHRLADFVAGLEHEALPDDVRHSARQRVLDILGIAIAATPLDTSRAVARVATVRGGAPQATAIGVAEPLPASSAAFVNGVLAHSLDYDDTHLPSVLHPSATIVPACLAVGEMVDAAFSEVVVAVAAGVEVCVRLGMVGYDHEHRNSIFFDRGQHATSICGAVAAAAAAARLLGARADGIADAMGIAASMASGIIEANRTGGTVKRIHCGWAAQSGVTAAELSAAGVTGPPTALEGRFGFFRAFLGGEWDATALTDGLGTDWEVPGILFKPYPANHFTHAGIDAAMRMRESGVAPDEIESLVLGVAEPTVRTIGEPLELKQRPQTGYQAQFSGPYTVIAALLGGSGLGLGLADFTDELATDQRRRSLMSRVAVVADDRCTEIFPMAFPAVVTARLRDGSTVVEEVLSNRGSSANPLSDEELARKFRTNTEGLVEEVVARDVEQRCLAEGVDGATAALLRPLAEVVGAVRSAAPVTVDPGPTVLTDGRSADGYRDLDPGQ